MVDTAAGESVLTVGDTSESVEPCGCWGEVAAVGGKETTEL